MKKTKEPTRKNNDPVVNLAKRQRAYKVYKDLCFPQFKKDPSVYWSRMVECATNEASLNGTITGLISIEALDSKIKKAKGEPITNLDNQSLEHPITYKVLALVALNRDAPMSFDEFLSLWLDNLITTVVTKRQNELLKKYQENFVLGVDCWKKMYERAGIKLVKNINLNNNDDRAQHGLGPSKRGRRKKESK